jgi:hypothetical protein
MTIFAHKNLTEVKPAGWHMWKILSGAAQRRSGDSVVRPAAEAGSVRLIEPPPRGPATPVECQIVSALKSAGVVSYDRLVQGVAEVFYTEELRRGAGVLDIGLLGSRLFTREVIGALDAANGILWEIISNTDER